jgi:hypothetical protein
MDFYDKLNSITHGAAVTEEVKWLNWIKLVQAWPS